jgi:gamma-glutamyltranspeptidase/glutathione hydrolase/leukotriene-C4 hydrolase
MIVTATLNVSKQQIAYQSKSSYLINARLIE